MRKNRIVLALALAALCLCAAAADAAPLPADMSGHYKFGYFDDNTYAAKVEMGIGAIKAYVLPDKHTVHLGIIVGEKIYFVDGFNRPRWGILTQIDDETSLIETHDADTGETREFSVIKITEEEANQITEENEVARNNEKCSSNIRIIGAALHRFARDNDDQLPYSLSELYPDHITDKNIFVCPARGGEFRDFDADYDYIPGFRIGAPNPDQERLIIENKGNHSAPIEFHYILYLDRHIKMMND
jgi:hypothetical protein